MGRQRDVSGLFDGANAPPTDRSPGIAPPPRPNPTPQPVPTPVQNAPSAPKASEAVPAPDSALKPQQQLSAAAPQPIKTALSLTQQQASWLHKQAARRDLWLGDVVTDLIHTHGDTARSIPVERARRKRNGSNYTPVQIYLAKADRTALDELVTTTGRSMAATVRLLIDTAITTS